VCVSKNLTPDLHTSLATLGVVHCIPPGTACL
jgi:hypothetical protein